MCVGNVNLNAVCKMTMEIEGLEHCKNDWITKETVVDQPRNVIKYVILYIVSCEIRYKFPFLTNDLLSSCVCHVILVDM